MIQSVRSKALSFNNRLASGELTLFPQEPDKELPDPLVTPRLHAAFHEAHYAIRHPPDIF